MQQIAIYVPSTSNVSDAIDNTEQLNRVKIALSGKFGGFTHYVANGGYVANNGELISEKIDVVRSFVKRVNKRITTEVLALARSLAIEMSQESVLVEIGSKVYFVEQSGKLGV